MDAIIAYAANEDIANENVEGSTTTEGKSGANESTAETINTGGEETTNTGAAETANVGEAGANAGEGEANVEETETETGTVSGSDAEAATETGQIDLAGLKSLKSVRSLSANANALTSTGSVADYVCIAHPNLPGGYVKLNSENPEVPAEYQQYVKASFDYTTGTLTLEKYTGGDACYTINDGIYACVYANCDLTIDLNTRSTAPDCLFELDAPAGAYECYGIKVDGNLIIANKNGITRTLQFKAGAASRNAIGIYSSKTVTVRGHNLTLNSYGAQTTDDTGYNCGIYAQTGYTQTDRPTVRAIATKDQSDPYAAKSSSGIESGSHGEIKVEGGILEAVGADLVRGGNSFCTSYGVRAGAESSLGSNNDWEDTVYCNGSVTVSEGATLRAKGGTVDGTINTVFPTMSVGIATNTLTANGKVEAIADEAFLNAGSTGDLLVSRGIWVYDLSIGAKGDVLAKADVVHGTSSMEVMNSIGVHSSRMEISGKLVAVGADAWEKSCGIHCGWRFNMYDGADITATAGNTAAGKQGSPVVGDGSIGAKFSGSEFTATGGSLVATAGANAYDQPSVGVEIRTQTFQMSGNASVKGIGGQGVNSLTVSGFEWSTGSANDSYGIYLLATPTLNDNAVLEGVGGEIVSYGYDTVYAVKSCGIYTNGGLGASGSGTIKGTGGSCRYAHGTRGSDDSYGIYVNGIINATGVTIIAKGGDVATETGVGQNNSTGGRSFGLYSDGNATFAGCTVTAESGNAVNPITYSNAANPQNDSYGAYFNGDLTLSQSTLTGTAGSAQKVYGVYLTNGVTLATADATLNANAPAFNNEGTYSGKGAYGLYIPSGFAVKLGKLVARGASKAIETSNWLPFKESPYYEWSYNYDTAEGEGNTNSFGSSTTFGNSKYIMFDASSIKVTMESWNYASMPSSANEPQYASDKYEGTATITYAGTLRKGGTYATTMERPTEAGEYTVTVTYDNGLSGSADFTITPSDLSQDGAIYLVENNQSAYNGLEQSAVITVMGLFCGGWVNLETSDYDIISGGTATNVEDVELVVRGKGNFTGERSGTWSLQKANPQKEHFSNVNLSDQIYDGNAKSIVAPTLLSRYQGCGDLTVLYGSSYSATPPTDPGMYYIYLRVGGGQNFESGDVYLGDFTIKRASNPLTVINTATVAKGGNVLSLAGKVSGAQGDVTYEISGADLGCTVNASTGEFTSGDTTGVVTVNVTAAGNEYYEAGTTTIAITVTETELAKIGSVVFTVAQPESDATYRVVVNDDWAYTLGADVTGYDAEKVTVTADNWVSYDSFVEDKIIVGYPFRTKVTLTAKPGYQFDLENLTYDLRETYDNSGSLSTGILPEYSTVADPAKDAFYRVVSATTSEIQVAVQVKVGEVVPMEPAVMRSASANLDGKIGLNFYVSMPDYILEDSEAYATITMGEKSQTYLVSDAATSVSQGITRRVFTYYVVAKEMQDDMTFRLYTGTGRIVRLETPNGTDYTGTGFSYSVFDYLDGRIANSSNTKMVALAKATKDYGIASQVYFNYNADGLAVSSNVTDLDKNILLNGYKATLEGSMPSGLTGMTMTLALDADCSYRVYYKFASGVDPRDYTYTLDNVTATVKQNSTGYYLEVTNIAAKNLDKIHTFTISNGSVTYSVKASALTYARYLCTQSAVEKQNLGKALYLYNKTAKEYLN
ncbi:MAG: hypothetical protein J6M66_09000 [Lachnospiraceae bacterium]|nr:hypothetical protein [Lachnospiraceae bacterium]